MAEGDTFAISALARKRAELAGRIAHAKAEIAKMQTRLAALGATLALFDSELRAELIPPKRYRPAGNRCAFGVGDHEASG